MPFASASNALTNNGEIKPGYKMITDKNGKIKYLSENKPKSKSEPKTPKASKASKVSKKATPITKPKEPKRPKKVNKVNINDPITETQDDFKVSIC